VMCLHTHAQDRAAGAGRSCALAKTDRRAHCDRDTKVVESCFISQAVVINHACTEIS
jgi:hypothetical protein